MAEYAAYYSNRLSYEEVEKLIKRNTGQKLLSDQGIWLMVKAKAEEISQAQQQIVTQRLKKGKMPKIETRVNIYDAKAEEVLIFDDGIIVKEQKAKRDGKEVEQKTRVNTDIVMLEQKDGSYRYLIAGTDKKANELVSLEEVVKSELMIEYSRRRSALPIVAITDGAKSIRNSLQLIFGTTITIILDWYHLEKKVYELFSMIGRNKEEKLHHLNFIFPLLWKGHISEVIFYLRNEVKARNSIKLEELISYLLKHKAEIIDYERRKQASKPIGSGRMEKGVDQVIGKRQKDNSMSWCSSSSKSLAILKVVELNGEWDSLWNLPSIAA